MVRNAEVTMWFAFKDFKVVRKMRTPWYPPRKKMRRVSCGSHAKDTMWSANAEHMMSGACEGGDSHNSKKE